MSTYSVAYKGKNINGSERPRANTLTKPNVRYSRPSQDFSTLLIWDPDAPAKSWVHWLIVNIPGSQISQGQEILRYEPPTPPSGIHRYFVTLYTQPGKLTVSPPSQRGNFNVENFQTQYNLKKFGEKMVQVRA